MSKSNNTNQPTVFTEHDWYGFAGCTSFVNGDDPVLLELEIGLLIADAEGASFFPANNSSHPGYFLLVPLATQALAMHMLATLPHDLEELKKLGFKEC